MILIDTDVLIWFLRGHSHAAEVLLEIKPWNISAVTHIELMQGCRNKKELQQLIKGLLSYNTNVVSITPAITSNAIKLVENYTLSSGMRLADSLIAATALEYKFELLSGNIKHFKNIESLSLKSFLI